MCPKAQLGGLYPRSEDLVDLTRSYDRGRASWAEVEDRIRIETLQLIRAQESLGFEVISDGALTWQDPLRPVAKSLHGIELGTRYSRWFDTNTFYQKPTIIGPISIGGFRTEDFVQKSLLPNNRKWKVAIPGPFTVSELSENKHYREQHDLILDTARAEHELVKRLVTAGASVVQLSEPCLVYQPYRRRPVEKHDAQQALEAIKAVVKGIETSFLVTTFFGDASPILEDLLELPVTWVGIDLYETDYTRLKIIADKGIVLGVIDSRESHIENPEWIAETSLRAAKHIQAGDVVIAPNSDLKFLPRPTADKKTTALGEAAKLLERNQN